MADDRNNEWENNDMPPTPPPYAYDEDIERMSSDDSFQDIDMASDLHAYSNANEQQLNQEQNADSMQNIADDKVAPSQFEELDDNLFKSEEIKQDAEELSDLEKANGINVDNNNTPELDPNISGDSPDTVEETAPEASFKLSERDYSSLDYFSSFRGDNLAVSDGDKVNEYIKSEGLVDKIDSLQDMSQEDKDSLKEIVYQESEPVSGQLGFPKNRLYEEIGDKKFGVNKNLNPDGSEIVHDKENLSEEGKNKEAKNEEAKEYDDEDRIPDSLKTHPSIVLTQLFRANHNKRNIHATNVTEKEVFPKSVSDMSLTEQANHFDKMNRDMDYLKNQMEKYEKSGDKHKAMKEDFELNKDSLSPEQTKVQQDKIKELNGNNNKQKINIEKQMDDMSLKMDDITTNYDPKAQINGASPHDKRTIEKMSKTMKETEKRTKELSEISEKLENKDLVDSKKSSGFKKSLENAGTKISDIAKKIAQTVANIFKPK